MDTKKKNSVVHVAILVVVIALIAIGVLLAANSIDFTGFMIKLHGG